MSMHHLLWILWFDWTTKWEKRNERWYLHSCIIQRMWRISVSNKSHDSHLNFMKLHYVTTFASFTMCRLCVLLAVRSNQIHCSLKQLAADFGAKRKTPKKPDLLFVNRILLFTSCATKHNNNCVWNSRRIDKPHDSCWVLV